MSRPDHFPDDECGFALDFDLPALDANAAVWIIATLVAVILASLACFFWINRGPAEQGHAVAILEQPVGGRP